MFRPKTVMGQTDAVADTNIHNLTAAWYGEHYSSVLKDTSNFRLWQYLKGPSLHSFPVLLLDLSVSKAPLLLPCALLPISPLFDEWKWHFQWAALMTSARSFHSLASPWDLQNPFVPVKADGGSVKCTTEYNSMAKEPSYLKLNPELFFERSKDSF